MITNKGYRITLPNKEEFQTIKNELTFIEKETSFNENKPKLTIKCYKLIQNKPLSLYVPRAYGIKRFGLPTTDTDIKSEEYGEGEELKFNGTLRENQQNIVLSVMKHFETQDNTGGILNVSTGQGKTVMALNLITLLKAKTIIFVNKQMLLDQWAERIQQFIPTARIGFIQGNRCQVNDIDICLAMYQTFSQRCQNTFQRSWFQSFKFLIVDETHNISTQTFSRILDYVQSKYRLGLTATLRKDGFEKVYEYHLGPVIVEYKPTVVVPKVYIYTLNHNIPLELNRYTKKPDYTKMITHLCSHKERNEELVNIILENITKKNKRKLILFTERVRHCKELANKIKQTSSNLSVGVFTGKTKKKDISDVLDSNIICATYSIAKEGFDLPSLDTLIFATPKKEITQVLGRILRKKNENVPLVIDIYDEPIGLFKGSFYARKRYYYQNKYQSTYKNEQNFNVVY